jgi:hypothetical protein
MGCIAYDDVSDFGFERCRISYTLSAVLAYSCAQMWDVIQISECVIQEVRESHVSVDKAGEKRLLPKIVRHRYRQTRIRLLDLVK